MNKPYNTFDLPKQHLSGEHYVPPKARRADERARRHFLPKGTILAEQQRDGLRMATTLIEHTTDEPDLLFVTDMLAASALNAGWYSYAQNSLVMRRRLTLPELADDETDWRETRSGLLVKAQAGLVRASEMATALSKATMERKKTSGLAFRLGRGMSDTALQLVGVQLGSAPRGMSAFDIQQSLRLEALAALERSRVMSEQIGVNPSIAQLADPDSPLAVHWRRTAPDGAYDAYERALEEALAVAA